jgi:hypothetical protein
LAFAHFNPRDKSLPVPHGGKATDILHLTAQRGSRAFPSPAFFREFGNSLSLASTKQAESLQAKSQQSRAIFTILCVVNSERFPLIRGNVEDKRVKTKLYTITTPSFRARPGILILTINVHKLQRPIFIQDVNNKQTVQKIANNLAIG